MIVNPAVGINETISWPVWHKHREERWALIDRCKIFRDGWDNNLFLAEELKFRPQLYRNHIRYFKPEIMIELGYTQDELDKTDALGDKLMACARMLTNLATGGKWPAKTFEKAGPLLRAEMQRAFFLGIAKRG